MSTIGNALTDHVHDTVVDTRTCGARHPCRSTILRATPVTPESGGGPDAPSAPPRSRRLPVIEETAPSAPNPILVRSAGPRRCCATSVSRQDRSAPSACAVVVAPHRRRAGPRQRSSDAAANRSRCIAADVGGIESDPGDASAADGRSHSRDAASIAGRRRSSSTAAHRRGPRDADAWRRAAPTRRPRPPRAAEGARERARPTERVLRAATTRSSSCSRKAPAAGATRLRATRRSAPLTDKIVDELDGLGRTAAGAAAQARRGARPRPLHRRRAPCSWLVLVVGAPGLALSGRSWRGRSRGPCAASGDVAARWPTVT